MAKRRKSKEPKDRNQEIRHLGVLIERVGDKVGLIAEQYDDIKKTLDDHSREMEYLSKLLQSHSQTLEFQNQILLKLSKDSIVIKQDIEFIKTGLKKRVDVDEFAALEKRVSLLEKRR